MQVLKVIGVDEAGRGSLAGPVAVGAAVVVPDFDWDRIPGVNDSKQLSPKRREEIFERAKKLRKDGLLDFYVSMTSAQMIDRVGITRAVTLAITRVLRSSAADPVHTFVKLDGLLHAPETFENQQTFIKGDATEKEIALASICAKVMRDRLMCRLAGRYPEYSFEIHKGYGTKIHKAALKKHGPSEIHRLCFGGVADSRERL